ncbi:MAG: biotin carboxylase N-terminal domain-containing protein [Hyphomicrobiaceae bacterium]
MLKKVLVANRGEIALRIMRTAKRMGIATVAVYSDADAAAPFVRFADEAIHIGPSPATESYLRVDAILDAVRRTGADCVHPGYGFLAENADFAEACGKAGITFVGPSPSAMRALGGKAQAKVIARGAGVPVVPGYDGDKQDARTLEREAGRIGYPVIIKAVAGGGGRGMRFVERQQDFASLLDSAVREAQSAFGDGRVLVEKVIVKPRHIEVQVFGDTHGNAVHLFERDCSLQRRNQKVIEEAPAPGMSAGLRAKMTDAAVKLAKAVGYAGAGTVEFLVEGGRLEPSAPWYFIEMNTRLQVEHPVTEEVTGLDLVEWQFRVAAGEPLPLAQSAIRLSGHAIEARLCAEDPSQGFMPATGRIASFGAPSGSGIRVESGVETGSVVSPFYDSMIAKVIATAPTRAEALQLLRHALATTGVYGLKTNAAFLAALAGDARVVAGDMDTGLIGREIGALTSARARPEDVNAAVRTLVCNRAGTEAPRGAPSPWDATDAFQLGGARVMSVPVVVDGVSHVFDAGWAAGATVPHVRGREGAYAEAGATGSGLRLAHDGGRYFLISNGVHVEIARPVYDASDVHDGEAGDAVRAPINGRVAKVFVAAGDAVAKGDRVAVVEAMKMEHVLHAARAGTIETVAAKEGQQVSQGAVLVTLAAA